ncbi:MAG: FHA domain-containing protein [Planctomicrobium sp.]|nr:FHA domain-containing protein [Planctomicrobium sp.]
MINTLAEHQNQEFTYSVQIPGGAYITRKLSVGDTVSVGSDDTADLRLDSPGIAGMHCLLTVEEGGLCVKDCYSPSGTFVNGQRIQDIQVSGGCTINLSEIEIKVENKNQPNAPQITVVKDPAQLTAPIATPVAIGADPEPLQIDSQELIKQLTENVEEVVPDFSNDPTEEVSQLLFELEQAKTENEVLRERLENLPKQSSSSSGGDPFQAEMLDLMKQEIEALQQELEKRNSQDFSFELNCESVSSDQLPKREEVEKLVDRLEDLLDELIQKDEQIQVLQDLVLASDSANHAEQEEREQLAKWLGEFEGRFEMLSQEWQCENEQLKSHIDGLEQERLAAVEALNTDSSSVKSETLKRMTDSLREDLSARQSEIHELKSTIRELNEKLKVTALSSPKEEEIRLARERAEIARMRHDVEVRLQKLDKTDEGLDDEEFGVVEQKLKSLTEQLREPSKNAKANASLSSRVLSLWGRLN